MARKLDLEYIGKRKRDITDDTTRPNWAAHPKRLKLDSSNKPIISDHGSNCTTGYNTPIAKQHQILSPLHSSCAPPVSLYNNAHITSTSSFSDCHNSSSSSRESSPSPHVHLTLLSLSENTTSVLFQYLSFQTAVTLRKTCHHFNKHSFKFLTSLRVTSRSIGGILFNDVNRLITGCSSYLKQLDLSFVCSVVDDKTLRCIGKHCAQLHVLNLHGCMHVTSQGVCDLLQSCLWLKTLDLSGCYLVTSEIGPSLARLRNLHTLNLAWCTEVDCNVVPYVLFLCCECSLRELNAHCVNKFVTLFPTLLHCVSLMNKPFDGFRLIGGLQRKTIAAKDYDMHVEWLRERGIECVESAVKSLSRFEFERKRRLLVDSEKVIGGDGATRKGYRVFAVASKSDKVYIVICTANGVFGMKLVPDSDFDRGSQKEFIKELKSSAQNPIARLLKMECGLLHWEWQDEFQSKRTLSLIGMPGAGWIKTTARVYCSRVNAFFDD